MAWAVPCPDRRRTGEIRDPLGRRWKGMVGREHGEEGGDMSTAQGAMMAGRRRRLSWDRATGSLRGFGGVDGAASTERIWWR
jgi:hypothetical protein